MIRYMDVKAHPGGLTKLTLVTDTAPQEFSEIAAAVNQGKKYVVDIKPYSKAKSLEQHRAVWAKIGEIASALGATKEEIYHNELRDWGPSIKARVPQSQLPYYEDKYEMVDIIQKRDEDGTAFIHAFAGLHLMSSKETSDFLDGILADMKDMGLKGEIHDA